MLCNMKHAITVLGSALSTKSSLFLSDDLVLSQRLRVRRVRQNIMPPIINNVLDELRASPYIPSGDDEDSL